LFGFLFSFSFFFVLLLDFSSNLHDSLIRHGAIKAKKKKGMSGFSFVGMWMILGVLCAVYVFCVLFMWYDAMSI